MAKSLLKQLPEIVVNGCKEAELICDTPLIFSFFSGAGFLDLGFEKAGYEIGYVNEVHKPFLDAYKYSRQKMGTPQPLNGYFEGDIECCLSGEEAKRLINAIEYGAPQDREHIILSGVRQPQAKKNLPKFNWLSHTLHPEGKALSYPWPDAQPIAIKRHQGTKVKIFNIPKENFFRIKVFIE